MSCSSALGQRGLDCQLAAAWASRRAGPSITVRVGAARHRQQAAGLLRQPFERLGVFQQVVGVRADGEHHDEAGSSPPRGRAAGPAALRPPARPRRRNLLRLIDRDEQRRRPRLRRSQTCARWASSASIGRTPRRPGRRPRMPRSARGAARRRPRRARRAVRSPRLAPPARDGSTGRRQEIASSRASRGSRPARRNDDLPAPEAPRITNSRGGARSRRPRSRSVASMIGASRPKKTPASTASSGFEAAIGRSGSVRASGGQREEPRIEPGLAPARASAACRPSSARRRRAFPRASRGRRRGKRSMVLPAARSTACHVRVSSAAVRRSGSPVDQDANSLLLSPCASLYSLQAPARREPVRRETRKITASQRVACLVQRPLPALAGRDAAIGIEIEEDVVPALLASQSRSATARRPSSLEWLRKIGTLRF